MITEKILPLIIIFASFVTKAEEPNWIETGANESIFVDMNSIKLYRGQKNLVNSNMVLNVPVSKNHPNYSEFVAYYGLEPISFFSNTTINCSDYTVRKNNDGISYGSFKNIRRNSRDIPYSPFKEGELLEFDKIMNDSFEGVIDSPGNPANSVFDLVCKSLTHKKNSYVNKKNTDAILSQVLPKLPNRPRLVILQTKDKGSPFFIDKDSIETQKENKNIISFTIGYALDKTLNQKEFRRYNARSLFYFFNNSINCSDKTVQTNFDGLASSYKKDALLFKYTKIHTPKFKSINLKELPENIVQFICTESFDLK